MQRMFVGSIIKRIKFLATVTRHVSSSTSLKKAGKFARACESGCRRGRPQTTRGIRKRCRIRAGWRHEWIPRTELPSRSVLAIRQVIRGPFTSPRLVSASPYVLVSSYCKNGESEICDSRAQCPRIKRGIPDPWAEYLAYRGFCSKDDQQIIHRDLELGCKNIYVTARVWKDLGLPLGQGIPDPWKIPVDRNKWVGEDGGKLHAEKRHRRRNHRYCGDCKQCQASTRISSPQDADPILPNPSPQQKTGSAQRLQQATLQHRDNLKPRVSSCSPDCRGIKIPEEYTAACNTHRYNHRPIDITKPPLSTTKSSTRTFLTSPGRPEYSYTSLGEPLTVSKPQQAIPDPSPDAKIHHPQVSGIKLSQETRSAKNLTKSGVQTSEIGPTVNSAGSFVPQNFVTPSCATQVTPLHLTYDFSKGQAHSSPNKIAIPRPSCGCSYQGQLSVQDVACACEISDFRKKRVGFDTRNLPCTETVCNPGIQNQNLNVMQLSCGCVHVSPCIGLQGHLGSGNRYVDFESKGGASYPENAFYGEYSGKRSYNPKPKMISRMKRLLNRCKPTSRPDKGTGRDQSVSSEIRVSKFPDEARLVCCQCSCPYLKVGNSPEVTSSKTVVRKKKKCACERCVAKRERREKRRSRKAATQEQRVCISPRSCATHVQVKPDQKMTIKCHNESCRLQFDSSHNETLREGPGSLQEAKQEASLKKEESNSPSAPERNSTLVDEMQDSCEVTKKLTAKVISLEDWRYPAVLGAAWYSSDSGENADVSEASRHTIKYTSVLEASPETSLVTSCTFISRINHNAIFQCLKKQPKRPKRGERLKSSFQDVQEIDSESSVRRNSLRRTNPSQIPTLTKGSCKLKIIRNQIPLLDIEQSDTKDSRKASSRMACIDLPVDCVSFYKNEMSDTSHTTNRDKKRENDFGIRATSRKKQIGSKLDGSTVDGSQVTVNVNSMTSYNRFGHSPSQRSLLARPKSQLVLDETENSTNFANDKLRTSDPYSEIREFGNSANPEDICDSSDQTRSVSADVRNSGYDPMITTIVSPRKIFTNSSTSCHPESCTRKCRKAPVPMNTPTDDVSSEDQGFPTGEQTAIVYRCELPSTQGSCFAKSPTLSNNTRKSLDSTPRRTMCSPAKVDGFLEGEGMESFDLNITEKTENETPREFVQEVRTLVQNGTYQGGNHSSADNKCFLKYCSLRRPGPCVLSPSHKIFHIQHSSYLSNENDEDDVPLMTEKQLPLGRRAFSSSSYQKNPAVLPGDAFARASTHPLAKVQDKFNIG